MDTSPTQPTNNAATKSKSTPIYSLHQTSENTKEEKPSPTVIKLFLKKKFFELVLFFVF